MWIPPLICSYVLSINKRFAWHLLDFQVELSGLHDSRQGCYSDSLFIILQNTAFEIFMENLKKKKNIFFKTLGGPFIKLLIKTQFWI